MDWKPMDLVHAKILPAKRIDPQTAIPWLLIFVTSSAKTLRSRFASEARLETCQNKGRSVIMDFVITYMENSAVNQSSMIDQAFLCIEFYEVWSICRSAKQLNTDVAYPHVAKQLNTNVAYPVFSQTF